MLQRLRQKLQPSDEAVRVAKLGLRIALEIAERACDGLPIPAAQGSITALLAILRAVERVMYLGAKVGSEADEPCADGILRASGNVDCGA